MRTKTLLLAASMLTVLAGASAQAADFRGPYVSLGVGGGVTANESGGGGMGSLAAGYAFGNGFRAEVQGEHAEAPSDRARGGELGRNGVFANGYYDFDLGQRTAVRPYLGAGVGYQWLKRSGGDLPMHYDGAIAVQGMAGASYPISAAPGLAVFSEYRVTAIPSDLRLRDERVDSPVTHSGLIGLRYTFGGRAPVAQQVAVQQGAPTSNHVNPSRTFLVFFNFDRADLSDRARSIVAEAAQSGRALGATRIEVSGHADRSGDARYNENLSRRRAEAVTAQLVREGVRREDISVSAYGESRPLVATADGVREPQNRRVEIVLR